MLEITMTAVMKGVSTGISIHTNWSEVAGRRKPDLATSNQMVKSTRKVLVKLVFIPNAYPQKPLIFNDCETIQMSVVCLQTGPSHIVSDQIRSNQLKRQNTVGCVNIEDHSGALHSGA
jgi:hypothetical protein